MASVKELKSILRDDTFEESRKCKKKKSKKLKKEKLDKSKRRLKRQQRLKDGCDESITFTQIPEIKKRKKRKKNDELPLLLTRHKNLSKRCKQRKDRCDVDMSVVHPGPGQQVLKKSTLHESSTLKKKAHHKRKVMFNLSPEEILPKSKPHPCALRDSFQTQQSSSGKLPSINAILFGEGSQCKPSVEEKGVESHSTPEDVNSQDLFITQKSFSDPYADFSSSLSTEEATAVPPYQNSKQCRPSQEKPLCKQRTEASTQTENFFTSPGLAKSLRFHHQTTCFEEPMDLSLPSRSRQELGLHQWDSKPAEVHSHPELKITDLTSSDESDILSKSRAALPQLKVVQTRLNESFFFKLKGEAESPKPRSPLMMLSGNVDKKLKK